MSEFRSPYEDDIDLFELFEIFWAGKWRIIVSVVVAALIGFGYYNVAQPVYKVSVSYRVNAYPLMAHQLCAHSSNNVRCLRNEISQILVAAYGEGWTHNKSALKISMLTATPLDVSEYAKKFDRFNKAITTKMHAEAATEIAVIENELNNAFLRTETVAAITLHAKRAIKIFDGGLGALELDSVLVDEKSKSVNYFVAGGALFGGVAGVFVVFVQNAIRRRKKQFSGV